MKVLKLPDKKTIFSEKVSFGVIFSRFIVLLIGLMIWGPFSLQANETNFIPLHTGYVVLPVTVTGIVLDEAGQPLVGVNIQVKGTNDGTSTDIDGKFTLEDVTEDATLIVSYVGYQTREVPVAGNSTLQITLVSDTQLLEELVVVGYGSQKKVNLTGAVSTVTSDALENRPIPSVGQGLQGLIPNLNVSIRNGDPTRSADFNIRGYESINGGSPLILVDGVPMDIERINPNDIASVNVLQQWGNQPGRQYPGKSRRSQDYRKFHTTV